MTTQESDRKQNAAPRPLMARGSFVKPTLTLLLVFQLLLTVFVGTGGALKSAQGFAALQFNDVGGDAVVWPMLRYRSGYNPPPNTVAAVITNDEQLDRELRRLLSRHASPMVEPRRERSSAALETASGLLPAPTSTDTNPGLMAALHGLLLRAERKAARLQRPATLRLPPRFGRSSSC